MKKYGKEWEAITLPDTQKELMFATETLGTYGNAWIWLEEGKLFRVGIPKSKFDNINRKYERLARIRVSSTGER